MTPLKNYDAYQPPQRSHPAGSDPFGAWSAQKTYESAAKLRLPLVLASSRLKLGSRRCDELRADIETLRNALIDTAPIMPPQRRSVLEQRLMETEAALHTERLSAWRDLLPLAHELRDAALEDLRSGFLGELTRLIGESAEDERPR